MTKTIAVWKPWLRPVRTMKTCAVAADAASATKVSQLEGAASACANASVPAESAAVATAA